jgi:hypothetical protein
LRAAVILPRTSRVGFAGLGDNDSPCKEQQQQQQQWCHAPDAASWQKPGQPAPSCLQQREPEQVAALAGDLQDEYSDSQPAVAEEDIPSSLWLPEFVGRKAAGAAAYRQPHVASSRGIRAVQGRPSSAAAAFGTGRPASSGKFGMVESSGPLAGSSTTPGRPVGGLLQARARPSSAAPKMRQ